MCSYNWYSVHNDNDTFPACGNDLMMNFTRETNFSGFFMSDWWAIYGRGYEKSGLAMAMPGTNFNGELNRFDYQAATQEGSEKETYEEGGEEFEGLDDNKYLNEQARRIVYATKKYGISDACDNSVNGFPLDRSCCDRLTKVTLRTDENLQLAANVSAEGTILLKNEKKALPLHKTNTDAIAIVGEECNVTFASEGYDTETNEYTWAGTPFHFCSPYFIGGSARVLVHPKEYTTIFMAIVNSLVESGSNEEVKNTAFFKDADDLLKRAPGFAGTVISCQWACASEEVNGIDEPSTLSGGQVDAMKSSELDFFKVYGHINKTFSALRAGNISDLARLVAISYGRPQMRVDDFDDVADAIVMQAYGGEKSAEGIVKVLFNEVNPSARLPYTLPSRNNSGLPVPNPDATSVHSNYTEYFAKNGPFETFQEKAKYGVGYGLSYSSFQHKVVSNTSTRFEILVSNNGPYSGRDTVFLRHDSRLADFVRTEVIHPNQNVTVTLDASLFEIYILQGASKDGYQVV